MGVDEMKEPNRLVVALIIALTLLFAAAVALRVLVPAAGW
jgi:hypothetical protein